MSENYGERLNTVQHIETKIEIQNMVSVKKD